MSRFKNQNPVELDAFHQMGRSAPSHSLDFAFNQPKTPFGTNPQTQPYGGAPPSGQQLVGRGGAPQGGGSMISRNGVSFVQRQPSNPNGRLKGAPGSSVWDMGKANLESDMGRIQAAGDRQFDRGQMVNQGMLDLVNGVGGRVEGAANREADRMDQFASELTKEGGAGTKDFDLANKYAADAVDTQKRAEKEYQDNNAQLMASQSEAIQRSFQSEMKKIDSSDMTDEEKQSAKFQLQGQMRTQIASAMAPLATRGQEMLAQLKNNLAQTQMGAGGVALQAGAGRGNTLQMAQRAREWSGNLRANAPATAAQLEMGGRTALAQMIRDNPETVVSKFQGLMALFGGQKAYGAGPSYGMREAKNNNPQRGMSAFSYNA